MRRFLPGDSFGIVLPHPSEGHGQADELYRPQPACRRRGGLPHPSALEAPSLAAAGPCHHTPAEFPAAFASAAKGLNLVVAVTDDDWFEVLRRHPDLGEVNFWAPTAANFRALQPGEMFLFKLHAPRNMIVGGGIFAYANVLPCSLAWAAFGEANGARSAQEMRASRLTTSVSTSSIRSAASSRRRRSGPDTTRVIVAVFPPCGPPRD